MKYKRYKHSRKGLAELFFAYKDKCEFIKDLLAQKEDKKECKHNWKLTPDTWGETCFYCGKQRKIKTTPSPLELPKINNNFSSMEQYNWAKQITDEVNKLYQLIKEKL